MNLWSAGSESGAGMADGTKRISILWMQWMELKWSESGVGYMVALIQFSFIAFKFLLGCAAIIEENMKWMRKEWSQGNE